MKEWLSEKEEAAVRRITAACNRADGTAYTAPLDADVYFLSCHEKKPVAFLAVYHMGDTVDERPVDELLLFTHPKFRGKKRAARLLKRYRMWKNVDREEERKAGFPAQTFAEQAPSGEEISGQIFLEKDPSKSSSPDPYTAGENTRGQCTPVLRFSAYPAEVTEQFLAMLGAEHTHDELLMRLEFEPENRIPQTANHVDKDSRIISENLDGRTQEAEDSKQTETDAEPKAGKHRPRLKARDLEFHNTNSECFVKTYDGAGYIYGVRTDVSHLREGSAGRLLAECFGELKNLGADAAILEVSSANIPAYRLYQKLGFQTVQKLEIWEMK